MKKKVWKFSNFSTADPRMASSHWLRPDLDAPGCCLFSDDLILIVLTNIFCWQVEQRYCKSFRWCHYLGKYFCTGCHSNNSHVIPARIIHQWNFRKYPVSNFALEILKSMKQEPVFNIQDLNPGLVRKVEKLRHVVHFRSQLSKLARYEFTFF